MSDATLLPDDDEPYIADAGAAAGAGLSTRLPAGAGFSDPATGEAGARVMSAGARVMSAGGLVFRRADAGAGSDAGAGGSVEALLCGRIRAGCGGSGGNAGAIGNAGTTGNAGGRGNAGAVGNGGESVSGYASASMSWRLPKGTPEPGESVAETARREVQEETGVSVRVVAPITSIRYFFVGHEDGVRYDKTVHFYLMQPMGGDTANHDAEFDVVAWHRWEDALALLEYDNERSVLETARFLIDEHGIDSCRIDDRRAGGGV